MDLRLSPFQALGSGPIVDRYVDRHVQKTRERIKQLMEERTAEIEVGVEHLTPAGERDKEREADCG
jgi:hypothetical protein